jgi:transcriptional regulator with XRE-family HTH domain
MTIFPIGATSNATATVPPPDIQLIGNWSGAGGFLASIGPVESALASELTLLHHRSGLTWDELARALGTTRRTVHNWAAGRRMSAKYVPAFQGLVHLVNEYDVGHPQRTRAALITPTDGRESPLSAFLASTRVVPAKPDGFSPDEII